MCPLWYPLRGRGSGVYHSHAATPANTNQAGILFSVDPLVKDLKKWGYFQRGWQVKQLQLLRPAQKRILKKQVAAPNVALIRADFSLPTTKVSHSWDQDSLPRHLTRVFSTRPEWRTDRVSTLGLINLHRKAAALFRKREVVIKPCAA